MCYGDDEGFPAILRAYRHLPSSVAIKEFGDEVARALQKSVLSRLQNNTKDKKTLAFVKQARLDIEKCANAAWKLNWSIPQVIKSCAENVCAQTDNSVLIDGYNSNMEMIRDITEQALRELAKTLGGKLRSSDRKIGTAADRIYSGCTTLSASVPRFQSICD